MNMDRRSIIVIILKALSEREPIMRNCGFRKENYATINLSIKSLDQTLGELESVLVKSPQIFLRLI